MIELIHNGASRRVDASAYGNAAELLRACIPGGDDGRSVILKLEIDRREVPIEALDTLADVDPADIGCITVETRPSRDVALESLDSLADYAGAVEQSLQRTADLLRGGRTEEGNQLFADVLDALSVLVQVAASASRVLRTEAGGLQQRDAEVRPWLEELAEAQQEQDWLRVADSLEYELRPRVARWPDLLRAVSQQLHAGSDSAGGH